MSHQYIYTYIFTEKKIWYNDAIVEQNVVNSTCIHSKQYKYITTVYQFPIPFYTKHIKMLTVVM